MADRYWVGGTGTWSSTNTANWSASSGGAGGESVPTAADNVIFDAGSDAGGAFVVTMANSPRVCNDFTASGLDFGMTLAGSGVGLTVSGSLEFPATNFTRTYTGLTTFNATTTGKTITTNGTSFAQVTFNGVGGVWTLGSAFSYTSQGNFSNGTFDTSASNYSVTGLQWSAIGANTTINLNGSTITLSGSGTTWSFSATATLNAGTSTIQLTYFSAQFTGGGKTYHDVEFTSTSSFNSSRSISGTAGSTFNNLTISTIGSAGINQITFDANQTINGTFTVNGSDGNRRMLVRSNTIGTTRTLTCAAIAATDVDFRDIGIAGAAAPLSGTRLGDCGGNTGITFAAGVNKYWNLAGGGNWNATAWATSSGGAVANTNFPLVQDTVIIENTGLNTSATVTINANYNIGNFDMSTRSNVMTLNISSNVNFYENLIYNSAITPAGSGTKLFPNRSIKTLDSAGKTFASAVNIDAVGGVQLINNNFITTSPSFTLTRGTLDLNDFDLTTGRFNSQNNNTRTIDFGTGEITCTGEFTVWTTLQTPGLTISGTPVVNVTSTGSTAITVLPGPQSEANSISFNFTGGTYNLTFLGSASHSAKNVNFTGYAGTWLATGSNVVVYGNLTLSSEMSLTATTNTFRFGATSGTQAITTNGKTMDFPVNFNGVGGTWQLQDAMTLGSTRLALFTNGTVDLNGFTLTSGTGFTAPGTKNITFNGGTLLLSGSSATATAWGNTASSNFTTTAGTGTGAISLTSASAKTFVGGGSTYNCTLNQGGAGTLTITDSNTFNDITNTVQPATILFTGETTQTVSDFTLSGTSGNLITIDSTSESQFTLSKSSGTVSVDFLDIQDSNATGGATWNAVSSIDSGNNTGWSFTAVAPSSTGNMLMMFI
jgi:hypothetical protein